MVLVCMCSSVCGKKNISVSVVSRRHSCPPLVKTCNPHRAPTASERISHMRRTGKRRDVKRKASVSETTELIIAGKTGL